jgi:transcriptional regulator of arginine metabolism
LARVGGAAERARRHARILQLVGANEVATQEEIASRLEREGFAVTQATVSRDIRDLRLVKVPTPGGGVRYAQAGTPGAGLSEAMLRHLFGECVSGYDCSENLVVLSTLPGTAQSVAEAVDGLGAPEVLGTLSGERTVFVVIKPKSLAPRFLRRLRRLAGHP